MTFIYVDRAPMLRGQPPPVQNHHTSLAGESNEQAAPAIPQRDLGVLQRQQRGSRGRRETLPHHPPCARARPRAPPPLVGAPPVRRVSREQDQQAVREGTCTE